MTDILGVDTAVETRPRLRSRILRRVLRDRVVARLSSIRHGRIRIVDGSWTCEVGDARDAAEEVEVVVRDPGFWSAIAFGGSVGAGESYAKGFWDCSDLAACLAILVRNRDALEAVDEGLSRVSAPLLWAFHKLRANSRSGSRKNIAAHYDLGNEFFALWLDPSMTYSSAVFNTDASAALDTSVALQRAQDEKLDRMCRLLELRPGDELCEIGSGWGSFAMHAARHYSCRVTTTTISARQAELARRRFEDAGLADRITLLERDYRDLVDGAQSYEGRFDALASIEMVEAVGHRFLPKYFETCARLLKPEGRFAMQAITISEQCYDLAKRSVDFIQRFIFPGCAIPSLASIGQAIRKSSDFRVDVQIDYAAHYAHTLRLWSEVFGDVRERLDSLGYDRFFRRLWTFYFAYCEAGFGERQLGLQQMLLSRAARR